MSSSFVTPWTVAHQAPLSIGSSRQECWSRLPLFSPGDLPDPGIEPTFPELAGGLFTTEPTERPLFLFKKKNPKTKIEKLTKI